MIDKTTLYSLSNRSYKTRRGNKGFLKKILIFLIVIIAVYFLYSWIFKQSIAEKNLAIAKELQSQGKIEEAKDKFEKAAKNAKHESSAFSDSLIGIWQCEDLELVKKYSEKSTRAVNNLDIYQSILIIENNKEKTYQQIDITSNIVKIAAQVFFEDKISVNADPHKELVAKINSTYNKNSKKIILAQYLNQNGLPHFGTEIAKAVVKEDINYRDAYLALGYGYLKNHNLEKSKETLLKATEIDPVHADTYKILAMTYKELGQEQNQKSCLEKAASLE